MYTTKLLQDIISQLEFRTSLQELSPKQVWNPELDSQIIALELTKQTSDKSAIALMAGLHLMNDNLHTSHTYAQQIEDDQTGSYWHGIMHRMEPDYSNSKYWFHRVGNHPVKFIVREKATEMLKQSPLDSLPTSPIVNTLKYFRDQHAWNSDEFVDIIHLQENGQGTDATREMLKQLQQIELQALFRYTCEAFMNEVK